jgi:hypothetical protein
VSDPTARALGLSPSVRPVLANHKKRAPPRQTKQKLQRAKIAIGPNTVPLRHQRDHFREQGPLLRIGVFTRQAIGSDIPLRILED